VKARLAAFMRERTATSERQPYMIEGGASFAYVFGQVLVFLLLVEAVSGAALAAFYSPSSTDAWASVAYIQDQATWGWLVRGVHHHGASAIVVVAGLHLVQTAVAGAYKRPRELVWWLGVLLLVLMLAWAVTGYVLRWDQAGYWANRVEIGIAAGTPIIGEKIRQLALGGNDYGNLTLTRFYALHVILLPVIVTLVTIAHVVLARRHGTTALRSRPAAPRWPDQSLRDALAMAITFAILLGYVISQHGADLASPADPAASYDARPLWYFRWLYELRELAGSAEQIVAMVVPGIVAGFLVALPLLDKRPERAARRRKLWLGALTGVLAMIGALTVMSFARDSGDAELAKRRVTAEKLTDHARKLARENGVPATGAQDVWSTAPMWKARTIYAQKCMGCHQDPKDRKGPVIGPGHGSRAWIKAFLLDPSGDEFWGRTDLVKNSRLAQQREAEEKARKEKDDKAKQPDDKPGKPDDKADGADGGDAADKPAKPTGPQDLAMPATTLAGADLDAVVELLYAQSGAADVDKPKAERGTKLFEEHCDACHSLAEGVAGASGPGLAGLGSRDHYTSFIGNPKAAIHMTADMSQMPRFDKELSLPDRYEVAQYLVWLRTATQADLDALGPLEPK